MPSPETKKQKLTLSVDAAVVEKARNLGLNMSEITENVLRGFAFEPKKGEETELRQKYAELFRVMVPLLKKYNTSVEVGQLEITDKNGAFQGWEEIDLLSDGHFWLPSYDQELDDITKVKLYALLEPNKILSNLIKAMTRASERNKKSLAELELARRIVEAIGDALSRNDHARHPQTHTRQAKGP